MDDLKEKIQLLESQLLGLQPITPTGNQKQMVTTTTDTSSSDVASSKITDWHTNPMSVPNAIRDDSSGYFLEEDIDIAAWISKISADISRPAFMYQMKVVFGSRDNFDTAFSRFSQDLLRADHKASMWITDLSTPLQIRSNIVNHEEKQPCSGAGSEHAAYMHLNQCLPAPNKGKQPVTGSLQSRIALHAPTPAKTGESSQQWLDVDLDSYNQVREPVLPYEEAPPCSNPDVRYWQAESCTPKHRPEVNGTQPILHRPQIKIKITKTVEY
ncbi:hypothetical protein M422DRAFT_241520 [Sphaerobolus stellatus SS14]|nr:hypothetical protein M422DRAFT_241520 [Sphaerobolus stellatus SS14]